MKNIFSLLIVVISINFATAQINFFSNFRLETGVSGFSKYKLGKPQSSVSSSYPYVEYNDINTLTTYVKAELGLIYIPYGKKSSFGFKTAVTATNDRIRNAFLTGSDRIFKTTILNYGIKIYPFANNKNFAIAVSSDDADEGMKYYGAILSGLFFEFGNSITNSSFERQNYSTQKYEIEKTKIKVFNWGESIAVFAGKKTTLGVEASFCKYKFTLSGGDQGKKQINNTHIGIWASYKLSGKK